MFFFSSRPDFFSSFSWPARKLSERYGGPSERNGLSMHLKKSDQFSLDSRVGLISLVVLVVVLVVISRLYRLFGLIGLA